MNITALNIPLLSRLVHWAVLDEQHLAANHPTFQTWGSWRQGLWAEAAPDYVSRLNSNAESFWDDDANALVFTEPNICGTAFCMAGQAAAQTNMAFIYDEEGDGAVTCAPRIRIGQTANGLPTYGPDPEAMQVRISDHAASVLGLTEHEGHWLFNGDNTIAHIVRYAKIFAEVRGQDLDLEPGILALDETFGDQYHEGIETVEEWLEYHDVPDGEDVRVIPNPHMLTDSLPV